MTNKDVFKVILCSYGYDRNIKIEPFVGDMGFRGYSIYAENKEGDCYNECSCEDFMFHIYMILNYMKDTKQSFKSNWWGVRIKDVCDEASRNSLISSWDKRDEESKAWAIKHKPIQEWQDKNNPCPTCKINKKDHWDIIHYSCELHHTHSCDILKNFDSELSTRLKNMNTPKE